MNVLAITAGLLLLAADQFTKHLARVNLKNMGSITVIGGILDLTYVENKGAAFGIMQGGRWFFVLMTLAILVGIFTYYQSLPRGKTYFWVRLSLVLISAGAVGNLIDRSLNGYVVDFFHARFIEFPVFNVADIYVVSGTILLAVLLLFFIKDSDFNTSVGRKDDGDVR